MAIFEDISKAFIKGVANGGFSLPIAYENVEYDEIDGEPFISMFLLPAQPVQATLGDSGCDEHTGILQLDLHYKAHTSTTEILQKADEINAVFKSGATFTNDTTNVRIRNVGVSRLIVSDGFVTLNMTIEYFAFNKRL